jgi:hypothetical protein
MPHPRSCFTLMLALTLLAGCAMPGRDANLLPGISGSAEVVARYGPPVRVWQDSDGGQTLEYSSQPFGRTCYMVKLGPDGKLVSVRDTLDYASRFSIEPGMTPEQVSRLLGRERSRVFFKLSGEDVWDWNVEPDQGGYRLRFNVHFKDGVVLRLSQSAIYPGRFPFMED